MLAYRLRLGLLWGTRLPHGPFEATHEKGCVGCLAAGAVCFWIVSPHSSRREPLVDHATILLPSTCRGDRCTRPALAAGGLSWALCVSLSRLNWDGGGRNSQPWIVTACVDSSNYDCCSFPYDYRGASDDDAVDCGIHYDIKHDIKHDIHHRPIHRRCTHGVYPAGRGGTVPGRCSSS